MRSTLIDRWMVLALMFGMPNEATFATSPIERLAISLATNFSDWRS